MCYKYKFLHICPPSTRMVKSFFLMLKDNFNLTEHYFLSRVQSSGCDGFTAISPNIINYNDLGIGKVRKFFALRDILSKSKNIIIHGFTFNIPWLIFLYFHKRRTVFPIGDCFVYPVLYSMEIGMGCQSSSSQGYFKISK